MEDSSLMEACASNSLPAEKNMQLISFSDSNDDQGSTICSSDVRVEIVNGSHTSASSAIATRDITKFPWEHQYLKGNSVAVHCSTILGDIFAYVLKAPQKPDGIIRIVQRHTNCRGMVKVLDNTIKDLAFAHLSKRVILAFTDKAGNLYIYEVMEGTALSTQLLLEVPGHQNYSSLDLHRVVWCPYIPEDQNSEDEADAAAFLLVATHGSTVEIWDVATVLESYGPGKVNRDSIKSGFQIIENVSNAVSDATFSPDGAALAIATLDGYVKFFQVYLADEAKSPRCLHKWIPHNGNPLSSLYFLDNHKNPPPDVQFWKYALTGALLNKEIKLWSCESWECYQTITFTPGPGEALSCPLAWKASLDPSSGFLLLSDIYRRVLYVFILGQNCSDNANNRLINCESETKTCNNVVYIAALPVQYPILSMGITDASWKPYKIWKHEHDAPPGFDIEEDGAGVVEGVVIKCTLINTKSLQDATIRFQPSVSNNKQPFVGHDLPVGEFLDLSVSKDSTIVKDGLTDLSLSMDMDCTLSDIGTSAEGIVLLPHLSSSPPDSLLGEIIKPDSLLGENKKPDSCTDYSNDISKSLSLQEALNQLLTPDSFSSPKRKEDELESRNAEKLEYLDEEVTKSSGVAQSAPSSGENICINGAIFAASSTSSPSLEVQQILHTQDNKSESNSSVDENIDVLKAAVEKLDINVEIGGEEAEEDNHIEEEEGKTWPEALENSRVRRGSPYPRMLFHLPERQVSADLENCPIQLASVSLPRSPSPTKVRTPPHNEIQSEDKLYSMKHITYCELEADLIGNKLSDMASNDDNYNTVTSVAKSTACDKFTMTDIGALCDLSEEILSFKESIKTNTCKWQDSVKLVMSQNEALTKELQKSHQQLNFVSLEIKGLFETQSQFIQTQLPQILIASLKPVVESTLQAQLKATLMPCFEKAFSPVKTQMSTAVQKTFNDTRSNITELLCKSLKSKAFIDSIVNTLSTAITNSTRNACKEAYSDAVIPSFNTLSQQMLGQLNNTFSIGTKEYLQQVENEVGSTTTALQDIINKTSKSIDNSCSDLTLQIKTLQQEATKSITQNNMFLESFSDKIRVIVHEELSKCLHEHQSLEFHTSRSLALIPTFNSNPKVAQQQIQHLISQKQFNAAFKQALSLSDLSLVVFTCERVNPQQIFNQAQCPLSQDVLLSMVNQLSHDLMNFTELKIKYLEEAVVNLNADHPVTQEHMHSVMQTLQRNLTNYLQAHPQNKKVKMLLMAVSHLISSHF